MHDLHDLGLALTALHRLQAQAGGSTMVAALEAWYSRAGVKDQRARLESAAEAMRKRGIHHRRVREGSRRELLDIQILIDTATKAYGHELRAA